LNLDDGEKFLREYILNMGWKTKDGINQTSQGSGDGKDCAEISVDDDSADEDFLEKVDEFEIKYNFRFEEEGGHAISSHARRVEDSVRMKESKRKRERDSKKARQEEEKKQKTIELQRLKQLKRQEIMNRLMEIEKATGNKNAADLADAGEVCLDTEFDPELHDQQMQNLLGEDYYEREDTEFVVDAEEGGDYANEEEAAVAENSIEDSENPWYFCDACIRPIRPGNMGYECKDCHDDEVTICHNCKKSGAHPTSHKLKKFLVADHEAPPEDWQSVLFQLKKKRTREIANGKLDEVYGMEYEDLIGGDIPCRFKYTNVDSDSFGLSTEAILLKNEKELNKSVSLKKLHPYRKAHPMKRVKYHDGQRRQ
jgi:protein KRI1